VISTSGSGFDVILVTAEPYADHPLSPAGVIARVLDAKGYRVGIIQSPDWKGPTDFLKLGRPRLFFGVTSGSVDSMLVNYSPLKRERSRDRNIPFTARMPDRAVIVYANKIRELHRGTTVVLGGIEASLRRFAHYDYWDDAVRRSILLDSRADIVVYGPGEIPVLKIAKRLEKGESLEGIPGTCVIRGSPPAGARTIPSFEEVSRDGGLFCEAQRLLANRRLLAQGHANRFVVQYPAPEYKPRDLDWLYGLPFSRAIQEGYRELEMGKFSVVTHRGCIGGCSFCALSLHQGDRVVSRNEESILEEVRRLTKHPDWKGFVDDLGGPTANMYGMDCESPCQDGACLSCARLDRSHRRLIGLMRKVRRVPGVKKVFVRSGIRYDLALESREYIEELSKHHVSGLLKIAPEHVSDKVLRLMGKGGGRRALEDFRRVFDEINRKTGRGRWAAPQHLKYYFMVAHPGTSDKEAAELASYLRRLEEEGEKPVEGVQIFTPTPMTRSTCMYHTGIDPVTREEVYVPRAYAEKKAQRRMLAPPASAN
jgi:uncharacterized radical SAM protein YgiQ